MKFKLNLLKICVILQRKLNMFNNFLRMIFEENVRTFNEEIRRFNEEAIRTHEQAVTEALKNNQAEKLPLVNFRRHQAGELCH